LPTARRSRSIPSPVDELWAIVGDPHHLPRWWPRVERVEDVLAGAFTEVMRTGKGRIVRADFELGRRDEQEYTLRWSQRVEGTPFGRVLSAAETQVSLRAQPEEEGSLTRMTEVTIELRQTLTGFFPRFGGFMVRRAAAATLEEALDGLERISG
jgi:uncharacterized protein YndB with AHSA1/START domain